MNTAVLDYRISEFETQQEASDYDTWLAETVVEARKSPTVSHDEALVHFAAKRIQRMEKLKNASSA